MRYHCIALHWIVISLSLQRLTDVDYDFVQLKNLTKHLVTVSLIVKKMAINLFKQIMKYFPFFSTEKPLSDLGKLSYRSYWSWVLLEILQVSKQVSLIYILILNTTNIYVQQMLKK